VNLLSQRIQYDILPNPPPGKFDTLAQALQSLYMVTFFWFQNKTNTNNQISVESSALEHRGPGMEQPHVLGHQRHKRSGNRRLFCHLHGLPLQCADQCTLFLSPFASKGCVSEESNHQIFIGLVVETVSLDSNNKNKNKNKR